MVSDRRRAANVANAKKSQGPKTSRGKARSAKNALAHGILSAGLLIEGESASDYDQLFQALVADLRPVGALELIHVERIATAVWRQRRLIRAETAAVKFRQMADDTRKMLTDTLGVGESVRFKEADLKPLTEGEERALGSFSAMLSELAEMSTLPETLEALKKQAPVYWTFLQQEAASGNTHVARYVCLETSLPEERMAAAISKLIEKHAKLFASAFAGLEKRLRVSLMRNAYQELKAIPPEAELFARYQTALDNSLTKAIRALREAQEIRISLIDPQLN